MRDYPAWAEQTDPNSLAMGAWYVWYSDDPRRSMRSIVHALTGGFQHQSPSACEEAAKKIATAINDAYRLGRGDSNVYEELFRSGRLRAHITKSHADGMCSCLPTVIAADVPAQRSLI